MNIWNLLIRNLQPSVYKYVWKKKQHFRINSLNDLVKILIFPFFQTRNKFICRRHIAYSIPACVWKIFWTWDNNEKDATYDGQQSNMRGVIGRNLKWAIFGYWAAKGDEANRYSSARVIIDILINTTWLSYFVFFILIRVRYSFNKM